MGRVNANLIVLGHDNTVKIYLPTNESLIFYL